MYVMPLTGHGRQALSSIHAEEEVQSERCVLLLLSAALRAAPRRRRWKVASVASC